MSLWDKTFWCFIGIAFGIILFSFDQKEHYAFFESFRYLMQHVGGSDDQDYLAEVRGTAAPPKITTRSSVPMQATVAYGGRPKLPNYERCYCLPLELGGTNTLENSFYLAPNEAARRDIWVQKFVAGYRAGKIPLALAQAVFNHRCNPGQW